MGSECGMSKTKARLDRGLYTYVMFTWWTGCEEDGRVNTLGKSLYGHRLGHVLLFGHWLLGLGKGLGLDGRQGSSGKERGCSLMGWFLLVASLGFLFCRKTSIASFISVCHSSRFLDLGRTSIVSWILSPGSHWCGTS